MSRLQLGPVAVLTLWVPDFPRALRFYRDILGLTVLFEDEAFARLNTEGVILQLHAGGGGRQSPSVSVRFLVEDVDQAYRLLVSSGAEPAFAPTDRPWGIRVAGVKDPAGNVVELAAPR